MMRTFPSGRIYDMRPGPPVLPLWPNTEEYVKSWRYLPKAGYKNLSKNQKRNMRRKLK